MVATAKHWVAYGAAEAGRDYNTTDVSERALREIYFPPFKAAVDAGVGTFMSAFNDIDGTPASANPFTLTTVLRGEWKFDGLVVSDYTSVLELLKHGIAADEAEAARKALTAGVDMEMVSRLYARHLPGPRRSRASLPMAVVDEAVRRILRVKVRAGLFENPYVDAARETTALLTRRSRQLARERRRAIDGPAAQRRRRAAAAQGPEDDRRGRSAGRRPAGRARRVAGRRAQGGRGQRPRRHPGRGGTRRLACVHVKGCDVEGGGARRDRARPWTPARAPTRSCWWSASRRR